MSVFDERLCQLGEGPLWHPARKALFWFDILQKRMMMRQGDTTKSWLFDEHHSAAGWIDADTLIIASETALWRFDIATGRRDHLIALESDTPVTRSNDGRADPWGGFWIGTMGKGAEPKAGAIYRYFGGVLRRLVTEITISNAISFAPDRSCAYYADTSTQRIMRLPLDAATGWPAGAAQTFVDLSAQDLNPDGAVTDAGGTLWVALWGAGCIAAFGPDGRETRRVVVPAQQPTCPAFGGPDLRDLFVTSAAVGLGREARRAQPLNGATFRLPDIVQGLAEPQVQP